MSEVWRELVIGASERPHPRLIPVIPANAGIQFGLGLDSRLRGNEGE